MILTAPTLPLMRERFRPVAFLKREVWRLVVDKVTQRQRSWVPIPVLLYDDGGKTWHACC